MVVRASCSLDVSSEQDARTTYEILDFLEKPDFCLFD